MSKELVVVLGSAKEGLRELQKARITIPRETPVIAVNDMIRDYRKPIFAAVTLHPEKMPRWLSAREANRGLSPTHTVIHTGWTGWFKVLGKPPKLGFAPSLVTPQMLPGQTHSGSSGLFAVKVALVDFGFKRVLICGMPMDPEGEHYHRRGRPWKGADRHREGWREARDSLQGRVVSMSGWTADFLGGPTKEWLQ